MYSTPVRKGLSKKDIHADRDEPATPSTMGSTSKNMTPLSHSSASTTASRKRSGQPKKRNTQPKKRHTDGSNQSPVAATPRKPQSTSNNIPDKPDATNINWLDPTYVTDLVNRLDPDGASEEDYEENISALLCFYKPQEIGLALLRTKMLLGDNNPQIPKLKKDKEDELIKLCIDNYNMKAEPQGNLKSEDEFVPEIIDLSNDEESR